MDKFKDLSLIQITIKITLTVITGLFGAWWFESDQTTWSWVSFIFTTVFIVSAVSLLTFIENWIKTRNNHD